MVGWLLVGMGLHGDGAWGLSLVGVWAPRGVITVGDGHACGIGRVLVLVGMAVGGGGQHKWLLLLVRPMGWCHHWVLEVVGTATVAIGGYWRGAGGGSNCGHVLVGCWWPLVEAVIIIMLFVEVVVVISLYCWWRLLCCWWGIGDIGGDISGWWWWCGSRVYSGPTLVGNPQIDLSESPLPGNILKISPTSWKSADLLLCTLQLRVTLTAATLEVEVVVLAMGVVGS
ncbi:hypothetical protein BDZ94DRAFT_1241913 [Collybia nuda]|uniref:Uncharacterized protein n=1 Tax=Collybia nuda TaxID=64659 RepID=A0A9P5XQX1_9AGAR|nr:hypothetical protein BDZ94DRAFT_1241913 [Collybia nuda]